MRSGLSLLLLAAAAHTQETASHIPFNITALSSKKGYSVLECWQLSSTPVDAMQAANYAVGNTTVATWSKIEPRTYIGEAWAPHVQLSVILNGLIRITSPASSTSSNSNGTYGPPDDTTKGKDFLIPRDLPEIVASNDDNRPKTHMAYIMPGTTKSSVLIAADLKSVSTIAGHLTEFPSDEPTILVQIPFVGDKAPEHVVLYDGPCI